MPTPPIRLIRRPEVQSRTSLPRSTLYALMKEGKFPKGHGIGYEFDQAIRMLKAEGYTIESTERPAPGTMQVFNHPSGQTWRALSLSQLEELHVTSRNMVVWGVERAYRITGRQIGSDQTGA